MSYYQVTVDGEVLADQSHPDFRMSAGKLKQQVSNAGSLSITIPKKNTVQRKITKMESVIEVLHDEKPIWSGRCNAYEESSVGKVKVGAEGLLCALKDTILAPQTFSAFDYELFQAIITAHNDATRTVYQRFSSHVKHAPHFIHTLELKNYTTAWAVLEAFLKECGGFYLPVYKGNLLQNGILWDCRFTDRCEQVIREGEGLLSFKRTQKADGTYNAILPTGKLPKAQQTEGGDNNLYLTGYSYSNGLYVSEASSKLLELSISPRFRRVMYKHYNDIETQVDLAAAAVNDLEAASKESDIVEAKALDMSFYDPTIPPLELGKLGRVCATRYDYDDWLPVVERELDLVKPWKSTVVLGGSRSAISSMTGGGGSSSGGSISTGGTAGENAQHAVLYIAQALSNSQQQTARQNIGAASLSDIQQGPAGADGEDGADGVSPTVTVTDIPGGHRVAITDATGEKSFDVMDGIGSSSPVQSVNGQTGNVVLVASDVGALPASTSIPAKTSDLTNDSGFITASDVPTKTSDLTNDSGFITAEDIPEQSVTSVNGKTGAVVLNAGDVGALANTAGVVRYDQAQTLTEGQKTQARANIGVSNASDKFNVFFGINPNASSVHVIKGNNVQVNGQEIKDQITVSKGGCILVVTDNEDTSHFVVYDLDDYTSSGAIVFYRIADGYRHTITVPLNSNVGTKAKVTLSSTGGSVSYNEQQTLNDTQKRTARRNIGMAGYAVPLFYALHEGQQSAGALYKYNTDGTRDTSQMTFSSLHSLYYANDKCFMFAYDGDGNVYKLKSITSNSLVLHRIDGSTEQLLSMDAGSAGTSSQVTGVNKSSVPIGSSSSSTYNFRVQDNGEQADPRYTLASGVTPAEIMNHVPNVQLLLDGTYELAGYTSTGPICYVIFFMLEVNSQGGIDVTTISLSMNTSTNACTITKRSTTVSSSGGSSGGRNLIYDYVTSGSDHFVILRGAESPASGNRIISMMASENAVPVVFVDTLCYYYHGQDSGNVIFRRIDNTRKLTVGKTTGIATESAV